MMRRLPALMVMGITLLITLSGCASLIIRNDDDAAVMAGKVVSRLGLGVLTYWLSELAIAQIKQQEDFALWWDRLTPEERQAWVRQQEAGCNLNMEPQPSPTDAGLIHEQPGGPAEPRLGLSSCVRDPPPRHFIMIGPQQRHHPRLGFWPFRHHGRRR